MLFIAVTLAYIFIVILGIFVGRALVGLSSLSATVTDLTAAQQAISRRVDQLAAANSLMQAGLLNLSNGAAKILDEQQQQKSSSLLNTPLIAPPPLPALIQRMNLALQGAAPENPQGAPLSPSP